MKLIKNSLVLLSLTFVISCGKTIKPDVKSLKDETDSVSYALGLDMAFKIKTNWSKANVELYQQGFRNGMDSINLLLDMNPQKINSVLAPFFQKLQAERMKEQEEKAIKGLEVEFAQVKKANEDFLKINKNKKGIITTPSGLQYKIIKKGKGKKVLPNDKVKIHYHGTTIDGKVFDSTINKKKPLESEANKFVVGFNEGLSLMNVGSIYKFFIPQELAYKYQQRGLIVKPFSTLIFEVEVLDIINE